tara:strand:+ start:355 stop:888 length:534 start_codon:yes stop_codon:yes gene_type:complete
MTLLSAYLSKSKVKKVLASKPGQEGFSLIELVVVVAVLAVLSAVAIPQFTNISQKARAAAASNTVATMAKECAVKMADAGAGTVIVPDLQGYKTSVLATAGFRWSSTVTSGATASAGTLIAPGSVYTCSDSNVFGFVSDTATAYPSFFYNTALGEKKCVATVGTPAATRGCANGTDW